MWLYIAIGAAVLLFLLWSARANELFFVSVREGKTLLVRGRITRSLLDDLTEAVQRPPVRRGTIRAVLTPGSAQLYGSGDIDELLEQRLRNIFRLHPAAMLRSAPKVARPTLGQLLGIAWLAWLLDRGRTVTIPPRPPSEF